MTQYDKESGLYVEGEDAPNSDDESQPKPSEPHQMPDKRTQTPTEKPRPEDGSDW